MSALIMLFMAAAIPFAKASAGQQDYVLQQEPVLTSSQRWDALFAQSALRQSSQEWDSLMLMIQVIRDEDGMVSFKLPPGPKGERMGITMGWCADHWGNRRLIGCSALQDKDVLMETDTFSVIPDLHSKGLALRNDDSLQLQWITENDRIYDFSFNPVVTMARRHGILWNEYATRSDIERQHSEEYAAFNQAAKVGQLRALHNARWTAFFEDARQLAQLQGDNGLLDLISKIETIRTPRGIVGPRSITFVLTTNDAAQNTESASMFCTDSFRSMYLSVFT